MPALAAEPARPGAPLALDWEGHRLLLWPERALQLGPGGPLLIADAHFGKAQGFRRLGVPVPEDTTLETLARLERLVVASRTRAVYFLGDLLHSRRGRSGAPLQAVAAWRARHSDLDWTLVRGNHDDRAGDPPPDWGCAAVDEPHRALPGLALCHHPQPLPGRLVLAGHLHPGLVLGRGADRLRLPAFRFRPGLGVLPAFGAFTGLATAAPEPDEAVCVVGDGEVLPATTVARAACSRAAAPADLT